MDRAYAAQRAYESAEDDLDDAPLIEPLPRRARGRAALPAATALPRTRAAAAPRAFAAAVSTGVHSRHALQLDSLAPDDDALTPDMAHAIAAHGLGAAASALPHLDAIQRSFGHHDVSGVRAHVGGAAREASAALGARAYAAGDAVAFATSPDLHLAAHEAAHVVQQRGGVRLSGGVGAAGDEYERHADAVAALVVRGESAEALLDPFAHRGAAGGPAIQRVPERRARLFALLDALGTAADLDAAIAQLAALHPALPHDAAHEYTLTVGGAPHIIAGRDVAAVLARARRDRAHHGTGEWNRTSQPLIGQTIGGHAIGANLTVTVDGIAMRLRHMAGWGVIYGGDGAPFLAAAERLAQQLEAAGQPYRAAAARGARVMLEGGVGAINTYDGMTFTLGPGYAGARLRTALAPLLNTPAGNALAAVRGASGAQYMAGLHFNGDAAIRLDVDALARIAQIVDRQYAVDFAEAWIRDVVAIDGVTTGHGHAEAEHAADGLVGQSCPEVVGVAEYLHHGYADYAGMPSARVADAVRAHPGNPSAQVAHILRAYGVRCAQDRTERPTVYADRIERIIENRLPNKVHSFIAQMRARLHTFEFDLAAARAVLPCITTSGGFTHTATQPGGVYLDRTVDGAHHYWDFG